MVRVLDLIAIDHVFASTGRVKPRPITLVAVAPPHEALRSKSKYWLEIRLMCPNEAKCLPADCFF
jgi:hypothetical protein